MAKRSTRAAAGQAGVDLDTSKFENVHQVGGIRLGTMDAPGSGGAQTSRIAMVNTGSGLTFNVALDRGGDVVEAFFNRYSLAFLSPVGWKPASPAYMRGLEWLRGWAAGLVTTCGPYFVGRPRNEDGIETGLHGNYSNCPATVESMINPDPQRGHYEMSLGLIVRDARMFGPTVEVRRQIRCALGRPEIRIEDQVTNRGNLRVPHSWLYHVNLGYPLLDRDAQFVYRGKCSGTWDIPHGVEKPVANAPMPSKRVPDPLAEHAGGGERGVIVELAADSKGLAHVGLINRKLNLGFELEFPVRCLPRIANWQHYGPVGSYVTGIEPFAGTLVGKETDKYPQAVLHLDPGQTRRYELTMRVRSDRAGLAELAQYDGKVE